MKKDLQILPSLLSANFADLRTDIQRCEKVGAKILHLDVMDGHFVPNISFGPGVISAIRKITNLLLDTHLMVENPDKYLEIFKETGTNFLTVHVETCTHLHRTISKIKELGMKAGVSLNPATSLTTIEEVLPYVDLVLLMTVNPGFGGQKYIPTSTKKISKLRAMISERQLQPILEVDGGIDKETVLLAKNAGAEYFVAGNSIFANNKIEENFIQLKKLMED